MITSAANPKLRYVRNLSRRAFRAREGRLAIEGLRLVAEALDAGADLAFALATPAAIEGPASGAVVARLSTAGVAVLAVTPELFGPLCDTATPQGLLAVVARPDRPWPPAASLVLILDQVRDPGNLGTALRGALAAGADGALVAPGTVDPLHSRAMRAGMGAQFRLPIAGAGWPGVVERTAGLEVWLADAGGETDYTRVDWRAPSAVIVGGEAEGASAAARALAAGQVRIPLAAGTESLNAGMAATVLLFEAARQRRAVEPR